MSDEPTDLLDLIKKDDEEIHIYLESVDIDQFKLDVLKLLPKFGDPDENLDVNTIIRR